MIIILVSASIVSAENIISKGMDNSQSSRQILTRKDIPVLSNIIALSKDPETKEILTEIRNKVSISGSITNQEIRELMEGSGWRPFIGIFAMRGDTEALFIPGNCILNLIGFYMGPFVVGAWESADLYCFFKDKPDSEGLIFLGVGLGVRWQLDPGARIFTYFVGICTLGFYKQY
jgi:hypothetical protein